MICDNFKHKDPDEFHGRELCLHDCIANKILFNNKTLRFYLPNGFGSRPIIMRIIPIKQYAQEDQQLPLP